MITGTAGRRVFGMRGVPAAIAAGALVLLAGCSTTQNTAPPPTTTVAVMSGPAGIVMTITDLQGNWGLASFRNPTDRPRTEAEAKSACSNPYTVAAGPTGGVMMYLPDQAEAAEVFVKMGPAGQTFIGPAGAPGMPKDRVVLEYANNMLVTDWVDASARERYGTMIFVRCGA